MTGNAGGARPTRPGIEQRQPDRTGDGPLDRSSGPEQSDADHLGQDLGEDLVLFPLGTAPGTTAAGTDWSALHDEWLAGKRPSTRTAYTRALTAFATWCEAHGRSPLPATSQTLGEYVRHLIEHEHAPNSITVELSAIISRHKYLDTDVPSDRRARELIKVYANDRARRGVRVRTAKPLYRAELRRIVAAMDLTHPRDMRDRLIVTLGRAMWARRDELHLLDIADVEVEPGWVSVHVATSKTDRASTGEWVHCPREADPLVCPGDAVLAWIGWLASQEVTSGPLLRNLHPKTPRLYISPRAVHHGAKQGRLTVNSIGRIIGERARAVGLEMTGHSVRRGAASEAARNGASAAAIRNQGRWHPNSSVPMRYQDEADQRRYHPDRAGRRTLVDILESQQGQEE